MRNAAEEKKKAEGNAAAGGTEALAAPRTRGSKKAADAGAASTSSTGAKKRRVKLVIKTEPPAVEPQATQLALHDGRLPSKDEVLRKDAVNFTQGDLECLLEIAKTDLASRRLELEKKQIPAQSSSIGSAQESAVTRVGAETFAAAGSESRADAEASARGEVPAQTQVDAEAPEHKGGDESGLFASKVERKRVWQRYMSTFEEPNGTRPRRIAAVPNDMRAKLTSLNERLWWFPIWVRCGEDWGKVTYSEILETSDRNLDGTTLMWITRDQAHDLMKSTLVGDAICDSKAKHHTTTRRHPDVPWLEEARQYLVQPYIVLQKLTLET